MKNKHNTFWCRFFLLAFTVLFCACSASHRATTVSDIPVHHLVVLHTNDTHGHPVKFAYESGPDAGGLPARATLVKQIRAENENVLLIDAGDLNTGMAVSNLFKARPDILGFNYIRYDAMAVGNHEFDRPVGVLKEQMEMANFPFLSANIRTKDGAFLTQPFIIMEFPEFKVAVFGLTTKETEFIGHPAHVQDLVFEDEVVAARNLVPKLRNQADVVIALVHLGIFESPQKGSRRLASEVDGIDLIVDGHSHTKLESPIMVKHAASGHETPIVQAWKYGLMVGRVDLQIRKRSVVDIQFEAIPVTVRGAGIEAPGARVRSLQKDGLEEDPVLLTLLQPFVNEVDVRLSEVVGHAGGTFPDDEVRFQETAIGNLIADSMLWFTRKLGVDFAIQNGGGVRAGLPEGPISIKQLHEILPFNDSVVVASLKGADVQALFDYMAAISPGTGAFPQVSEGVRFTINRGTGKCEGVLIDGKPIEPGRTYRIATNSYLAAGGDGYKIFLESVEQYNTAAFQREVLEEYIRSLGETVEPETRQRITILSSLTIRPAYFAGCLRAGSRAFAGL
jgi:5'-nucleotidase/UDP-sugar diphosphatase